MCVAELGQSKQLRHLQVETRSQTLTIEEAKRSLKCRLTQMKDKDGHQLCQRERESNYRRAYCSENFRIVSRSLSFVPASFDSSGAGCTIIISICRRKSQLVQCFSVLCCRNIPEKLFSAVLRGVYLLWHESEEFCWKVWRRLSCSRTPLSCQIPVALFWTACYHTCLALLSFCAICDMLWSAPIGAIGRKSEPYEMLQGSDHFCCNAVLDDLLVWNQAKMGKASENLWNENLRAQIHAEVNASPKAKVHSRWVVVTSVL